MQDRCLGLYFGAPKIKFSAIDRDGKKLETNFTNDVSQNVLYHFKAPTNQFYIERIAPYLYTAASEPPMKADGKCGHNSYSPVAIEKSSDLVKWKMDQINPIDPAKVTDLEFSIYSQQEADLRQEYAFTTEM